MPKTTSWEEVSSDISTEAIDHPYTYLTYFDGLISALDAEASIAEEDGHLGLARKVRMVRNELAKSAPLMDELSRHLLRGPRGPRKGTLMNPS